MTRFDIGLRNTQTNRIFASIAYANTKQELEHQYAASDSHSLEWCNEDDEGTSDPDSFNEHGGYI